MLDKTIVYLVARRDDEMVVERRKDLEIAAILRDLRHLIEPRASEYNHKFGFDSDLSSLEK